MDELLDGWRRTVAASSDGCDDYADGYGWRVVAEDAIQLLREILPWAAGAEMRAALLGGGAGGGDLEWLTRWIDRARAVVAQMEVRNDVG